MSPFARDPEALAGQAQWGAAKLLGPSFAGANGFEGGKIEGFAHTSLAGLAMSEKAGTDIMADISLREVWRISFGRRKIKERFMGWGER